MFVPSLCAVLKLNVGGSHRVSCRSSLPLFPANPKGLRPLHRGLDCSRQGSSGGHLSAHLVLSLSLLASSAGLFITTHALAQQQLPNSHPGANKP